MAISRKMTRRRRRILRSAAIAALGLAGPSGVAQAETISYSGATVNDTVATAGT